MRSLVARRFKPRLAKRSPPARTGFSHRDAVRPNPRRSQTRLSPRRVAFGDWRADFVSVARPPQAGRAPSSGVECITPGGQGLGSWWTGPQTLAPHLWHKRYNSNMSMDIISGVTIVTTAFLFAASIVALFLGRT